MSQEFTRMQGRVQGFTLIELMIAMAVSYTHLDVYKRQGLLCLD